MAEVLSIAEAADLYLISVGELLETSFLRQQAMLSAIELRTGVVRGLVIDGDAAKALAAA